MEIKKLTANDLKALEGLTTDDERNNLLAYCGVTGFHPADAVEDFEDNSEWFPGVSVADHVFKAITGQEDFYGNPAYLDGALPEYIIPFIDAAAVEKYYKESGYHDLIDDAGNVIGSAFVQWGVRYDILDEDSRVKWER